MSFEGPGLTDKPEPGKLLGFESLMPPVEKKPGLVKRVLAVPLKLIALPFKAVGAVLRLPARLFRRGTNDEGAKA